MMLLCRMTGMASLPISSLLVELAGWLHNPRVEVILTSSEDVQRLEAEIETLHGQIAELEMECHRAQARYGQECVINLRLQDILRAHGISFRGELK